MVVEHMQHVIDVAGEDFVSIGSDYDGAITAKNLIGFLRQINNVHNVGFLVLGSPPPASSSTQQQAFAQSVLRMPA